MTLDKVRLVTFCEIEKEMARRGNTCLFSQRSGEDEQDVSSKTASLDIRVLPQKLGMERRREGQTEAAMRLSFDFGEISLFQQGVTVPEKKNQEQKNLLSPSASFLFPAKE